VRRRNVTLDPVPAAPGDFYERPPRTVARLQQLLLANVTAGAGQATVVFYDASAAASTTLIPQVGPAAYAAQELVGPAQWVLEPGDKIRLGGTVGVFVAFGSVVEEEQGR
jgi:hypothetical protein